MRIDKYLKVSRLIKRRTVANEACDGGRITVNDKKAKPSTEVNEGDVITIGFGTKRVVAKVLAISERALKQDCPSMYEIISED